MNRLSFALAAFAFGIAAVVHAEYPAFEPVNPYPPVVVATPLAYTFPLDGSDVWDNVNDAKLVASDGRLTITATGSDPYFCTADIAAALEKSGVPPIVGSVQIEMRIRSASGTAWQIFWTSRENPHWSESQAKRFTLPSENAWHDITLTLDNVGMLKNLRIDPGTRAGVSEIELLKLHRVEYSPERPQIVAFDASAAAARSFNDAAILVSPDGKTIVRFPRDPSNPPFAREGNRALIERDGKCVAVIAPLVSRDDFLPVGGRRPTTRVPQHRGAEPLKLVRVTDDEVAFASRDENRIWLQLRFWFDATNELNYELAASSPVHGPIVRTFGTMEQAILPGVEYLERGEHSSSKADIETAESLRYSPSPLDVTIPLAVIATDRASVALLYDDPTNCVVFATPNFLDDDQKSHRVNIFGAKQRATIRIGDAWSETNRAEDAVLWGVRKRGLYPLPQVPRTAEEQRKLNLAGLTESFAHDVQRGWAHAIIQGNPNVFPFNYSADCVSTIWQITGELPDVPRLDFGGAHLNNSVAYFLTGRAQTWRNIVDDRARELRNEQRGDGTFGYAGQYLRGHWEDTASGFTGFKTFVLLEHWRETGNALSLAAGLRGAESLEKFRTPRGAQTWELSLHTPDIMASAWGVLVCVRAFEATQDNVWLERARRWAISGLPFVYQWHRDDLPVMAYATTPVFGATNFVSPNWIGLPVQWCGLDFAEALFILAEYDPPSDKNLDWRKVAEGILISGEQQQYVGGDSIGLLPDSFTLSTQTRNPADINPVVLERLRRRVQGLPPELIVSVSDDGAYRVIAPFPATFAGNVATFAAPKETRYQVVTSSGRVVDATGNATISCP
ncbi:MAG: hypothetical protein ACRC46_05900 [Thermoguttaceae bacterium]